MNKALLNSLTEAETLLIAETEREAMADLDEDALLELHGRIRRARTKYTKLYRRRASLEVAQSGGRGLAHGKNQRNRDKAELFELALARASRQVERVAKQTAAELRAERIAAARGTSSAGRSERPPGKTTADEPAALPPRSRAVKTTGGVKKDASTRAEGARRQAKRDNRSVVLVRVWWMRLDQRVPTDRHRSRGRVVSGMQRLRSVQSCVRSPVGIGRGPQSKACSRQERSADHSWATVAVGGREWLSTALLRH